MKNTSVQEANLRFSLERKKIRNDYQAQVQALKAELHAKVQRLQYERDKKLLDVSRRQDEFEDNFRQWKRQQYLEQLKEQPTEIK